MITRVFGTDASKSQSLRPGGQAVAIDLETPAPGVCLWRVVGHISADATREYMNRVESLIRRHYRLVLFADWERAGTYDLPARVQLTLFMLKHRTNIGSLNVMGTLSKTVRTGLALANIPLKNAIRIYPTREEFDAAYRARFSFREARRAI